MTSSNLSTRLWMRKKDLFDKDVEIILTSQFDIQFPEQDFKKIKDQRQWDKLYRLATVERFKELQNQESRNRLEKKLNKLEKEWRRISGVKKTVITKKTGNYFHPKH